MINDDGDEGLDVDDGSGLCPKGLVGALVRVQRGGAETGLLGTACFFSAGFGLSGEATFFGGGGGRSNGGVSGAGKQISGGAQ